MLIIVIFLFEQIKNELASRFSFSSSSLFTPPQPLSWFPNKNGWFCEDINKPLLKKKRNNTANDKILQELNDFSSWLKIATDLVLLCFYFLFYFILFNDILFNLKGHISRQEAVSMIPPLFLKV
jgi:hypothetical protein